MESRIANSLRPEFQPVAVVWSDTIPTDALQFKKAYQSGWLHLPDSVMEKTDRQLTATQTRRLS